MKTPAWINPGKPTHDQTCWTNSCQQESLRGNSESIPHHTNKVSQPKQHKKDLPVSQNLLYYSWNALLHMEFRLHQKAAGAQPESSATTTPCKKRLEISELFPSRSLLIRLGTPAEQRWRETLQQRPCLEAPVRYRAQRILWELQNSGNTNSPGKGRDSPAARHSECLKAWKKQVARSPRGAPHQAPRGLPRTVQL